MPTSFSIAFENKDLFLKLLFIIQWMRSLFFSPWFFQWDNTHVTKNIITIAVKVIENELGDCLEGVLHC